MCMCNDKIILESIEFEVYLNICVCILIVFFFGSFSLFDIKCLKLFKFLKFKIIIGVYKNMLVMLF